MRITKALLTGVLLATTGVAAGCTGDSGPDCDALAEREPEGGGSTVFLVDISASTGASGPGPDYPDALAAQLQKAVEEREDEITIGSFDGSAATVRWEEKRIVTRSEADRSDNRQLDHNDAKTCLAGWLAEAAAGPPRTSGTDVLGAIKTAARYLDEQEPASRTVVMATDGFSTTGCANLAAHPVGDPRLIDQAAATCPQAADWPAELAGAELVMLGVGHSAAATPIPSTGHLEWLNRYWTRLCEEADAASCDVSTAPVAEADRNRPVDGHDDPEVSFAAEVVYLVPEDVLFDTASWRLRPGGRDYLVELAGQLRAAASGVEVVGHADSRGDPDYNLRLSRRRAESVAEVLQAEGITVLPPQGMGAQQLLCPQERHRDGSWDEECLQRNRRVEIRIPEGATMTDG